MTDPIVKESLLGLVEVLRKMNTMLAEQHARILILENRQNEQIASAHYGKKMNRLLNQRRASNGHPDNDPMNDPPSLR